MRMAGSKRKTEKTKTGFEVPIPKRGEFFGNLKKVAGKPDKGSTSRRPRSSGSEHRRAVVAVVVAPGVLVQVA